ncbi:MAG: hypothetical protein HYU81_02965 [Candidatus Brennerbacteria bacterium]|nr:hypothetical protein [Candidatus Brennerbacteria bacterium]
MQNSVNVVSQSKDEERDTKPLKIAGFAAAAIGANLLAVKSLTAYLAAATPELLLVAAGAGTLFIATLTLQAFFVKSSLLLRGLVLAEILAPLAFFTERLFPSPSVPLLVAALLFFLFAATGSVRGLRHAATGISVRFFDIAHAVIPKAITGALLFMTVVTYLTYVSWGTIGETMGKKFVSQFLSSSEPLVRLYAPRFSAGQSVGTLFEDVVRAELEKGRGATLENIATTEGSPEVVFRDLPVPVRDALVAQATERLRRSIEPAVGPLDPQETVRDAAYRILERRISSLSPSQYAAFSVGAFVLVFFSLKGFFSLFHWLIALIAYLVFKFLMALGFARVGVATQTREFVLLS